jgi:hypothetical protein
MNIQIILCSRGRPERFRKMLDSVRDTQSREIPVNALVDSDDPKLEEYMKIRGINLVISNLTCMGERTRYLTGMADADIYMWLADDVILETKDWDRILESKVPPHGICAIQSNEVHNQSMCHPIVTKRFLELIGGWLPGIKHWYLDSWIEHIARDSKTLIRVPEVVVHHYHFSQYPELRDATYEMHNDMYQHDGELWNKESTRQLMSDATTRIKEEVNAYNRNHQ